MEYSFHMLDKKDLKILEILKENSNLSTQQISKKTAIPITTVHHRIKKLERDGIVQGYTVLLDNQKIDRGLGAYILINVDYSSLKQKNISQHDLALKIKKHEFVEEVCILTGGIDIIIKVRVKDISQMDEFVIKYLRNIDGIEKTQTLIMLHEF